MIAYFDTSAIVPLIIDEATSLTCKRLWNDATRAVSVRLMYVEARAVLAMAQRMDRLTTDELASAVKQLHVLVDQIDSVEVSEALVRGAGAMAQEHGLRGYDAVHLAAARTIADVDTVFVSGDQRLTDAAAAVGLAVTLSQ